MGLQESIKFPHSLSELKFFLEGEGEEYKVVGWFCHSYALLTNL